MTTRLLWTVDPGMTHATRSGLCLLIRHLDGQFSRMMLQGRSSGVNFALPIDLAVNVVPNLIIYGNASGKGVKGQ